MATYTEFTPDPGPKGLPRSPRLLVEITEAADVTEEVLECAEDVYDGWFADRDHVDWDEFWDRLDGYTLKEHENREMDMGTETNSPAMRKIKRHIRRIAREG